MPLNYTLKWVKMVNFVYVLPQGKYKAKELGYAAEVTGEPSATWWSPHSPPPSWESLCTWSGQEPVGGRAPFVAPGRGVHVITEPGLVWGASRAATEMGVFHSCADDLVGQTRHIAPFQRIICLFCVNSIRRAGRRKRYSPDSPHTAALALLGPAPGHSTWRVHRGGGVPCRGPVCLPSPGPGWRGSPHIPALCPAHLRSASGRGLREPSRGHLVSGPREAPVMNQEGTKVNMGISRLTPSQSRRVLRRSPPPRGGAQSSVFVECFPAGPTPSHLAERLLRFVLGRLKHQLTLLASVEKT